MWAWCACVIYENAGKWMVIFFALLCLFFYYQALLKSNPLIKFGKFVVIVLRIIGDYNFIVESVNWTELSWTELNGAITLETLNTLQSLMKNSVSISSELFCYNVDKFKWDTFYLAHTFLLLQMQSKYSSVSLTTCVRIAAHYVWRWEMIVIGWKNTHSFETDLVVYLLWVQMNRRVELLLVIATLRQVLVSLWCMWKYA